MLIGTMEQRRYKGVFSRLFMLGGVLAHCVFKLESIFKMYVVFNIYILEFYLILLKVFLGVAFCLLGTALFCFAE